MKRNTKITIAALCTMFVMAIAVSALAFSNASRNNNSATITDASEVLFADGSLADTYTNIDNIIANSNASNTDADRMYHIVEIGSSDQPSGLQEYVLEKRFEEFVLNSYSTQYVDPKAVVKKLKTMAPDSITYDFFNASSITNNSDAALKTISKADLIYISNDAANAFSHANDLAENLYDLLHVYAVGSYKPLIIDAPSATSASVVPGSADAKTMTALVDDYFNRLGSTRYTFAWDKNTQTVEDFLQHKNGSLYLGIHGDKKFAKGNWSEVYDNADLTADNVNSYKVSKALAISTSDVKSNALQILTGDASTAAMDLTTNKLYDATGTEIKADNWYNLATSSVSCYNGRKIMPDYVQVDAIALSAITNDFDLDQYDIIVFEDDAQGVVISTDLYTKFVGALYSNMSIVYPASFAGAGSPDEDLTGGGTLLETYNFLELYNSVVSAKGEAKYPNILNTTRNSFSVITAGQDKGTAKVIVDLINSSSYRGIGGNGSGSSSSMFTVLEIQPCYPIDRELAQKQGENKDTKRENGVKVVYKDGTSDIGNYYIYPTDVINGKTKEQIPEDTEYYAWELSEAKIADAYGLDVNQVNLIHMSSEELASCKKDMFGNIDMLYIGGNTSAIKKAEERAGTAYLYDPNRKSQYQLLLSRFNNGATAADVQSALDRLTLAPIYDMYSHNGDVASEGSGAFASGLLGAAEFSKIGVSGGGTFLLMNGNDISYNNYIDLKKFVDAGLPVIISSKVTNGYNLYKQYDYKQNSLDPQSNMVRLLNECFEGGNPATPKSNVFAGFKEDAVVDRDNDAGRLGDTLTGYVSVFAASTGSVSESEEVPAVIDPNDDVERNSEGKTIVKGNIDEAIAMCRKAKSRPKLTVTNMPPRYNMYDASTKISNRNLTFDYRISGSTNYTVYLYIDDNANSKFDRAKEQFGKSTTNQLKYTVADAFNGPLYWMLEVVDNDNGLSTYTTGIAFIKSANTEKQIVRVLQIMPGAKGNSANGGNLTLGEGPQGDNTLYFCVDCQKSYQRFEYNPMCNDTGNPRNHYESMYDGKIVDYPSGYNGPLYLGKHLHRFGIPSYDSTIPYKFRNVDGITYGRDDWSTNLADEVSDLYDFELEILLREEFETYANDVRTFYDEVDTDTKKWSESKKKDTVNNFNLEFDSKEDEDAFKALTLNEQVKYVLRIQNQQEADKYYQYYQLLRKETMDVSEEVNDPKFSIKMTVKQAEEKFLKELNEMLINNPTVLCSIEDENGHQVDHPLKDDVDEVLRGGAPYSELFGISLRNKPNGVQSFMDLTISGKQNSRKIQAAYNDYMQEYSKMVTAFNNYKKYSRLAAGEDWLKECYDCVIIGASEDFAGDDIGVENGTTRRGKNALTDLCDYIENDGKLLVFHDTLTASASSGTSVFTKAILKYFGNDRYKFEVDNSANPQTHYVKYKTTATDENPYFMTNISSRAANDPQRYSEFDADLVSNFYNGTGNYLSRYSYTDYSVVYSPTNNDFLAPYRYVEGNWSVITNSDQQDSKFTPFTDTNYGTNKASQNNEGIVTLYPFTLSSELNVAPTHSQIYAVDVESEDMTVWYSLAGGYNSKVINSRSNSAYYAADPRDGMDNYFIYSYGNVTYCGAGHCKVTGAGKDNNDERKLYINIICNSVRKSVKQPSIYIYDYQKETCGDKIKKSETGEYYTKVDSTIDYTDFNFKAVTDDKTKLKSVRIYFDLDYSETNTSNAYVQNDKHKLIAYWTSAEKPNKVKSGLNVPVFRYDDDILPRYDKDGNTIKAYYNLNGTEKETRESMLQLQPEYFDAYDGYHTYIVIEAIDSQGTKTYQRLKIMLKENLFNLT